MLNKTLKASKNVTESAPKQAFSKKQVVLVVVLVLAVASSGFLLTQHPNLGSVTDNNNDCTLLSSEQASKEVCIELELVQSREALFRGLSGRESLLPEEGMLFDFQSEGERCMVMRDMNFSLDMIWLDQSGVVVDAETDIHPDTYPDQMFCNEAAPARYVIEVTAGIVEAANVTQGQQIQL